MGGRIKCLTLGSDGRTLLENIDRVLGPLVSVRAVVAPRPMHAALCQVSDAPLIADSGAGPLSALKTAQAALGANSGTWTLVVGGDHPFPSLRLAERLWLLVERGESQVWDAAIVRKDGYPQPLFAVYRGASLANTDATSFRSFLESVRVREIPAEALSQDEANALLDMDHAEDAERLGLDPSRAPDVPSP